MSAEDASVERLTNLTFALLGAESPRSYEWVHAHVDGYDRDLSEATFHKKLTRDVASLRRAGVPARMEGGTVWVNKDTYELPPIEFTESEAAVLGLAGDLGQQGSLGAFARSGWTKLAASGATRTFDDGPLTSVDNDVLRVPAETVQAVTACVRNQQRMSFKYQPTPTAEKQRRVMDPWGIVALNNRAYVVGWDVERQAERSFRALRVTDVKRLRTDEFVPATRPLQEVVEDSLRGPLVNATVKVSEGKAHELVDKGTRNGDTVTFTDVERDWFVRTAASFAPDAVVIEPEDVRADVIALLKKAEGSHG
ncbi:helix-turn-helix transcriptional regulator [Corynebacterium sp. S7]